VHAQALWNAASSGDVEEIRRLVDLGADLVAPDPQVSLFNIAAYLSVWCPLPPISPDAT
jgi:hypothetical protein